MSTKITVRIETVNGHDHLSLELNGEESGDNPRFNAAQVDSILDGISSKVRQMFKGYFGEQA